jgi:DNA replication licensing factor MCM3
MKMWYVEALRASRHALTTNKIYYCAYTGSFGENACNPRTLSSQHLNRMVSLEGIVTKCSLVRPKIVKSVHWNERMKDFLCREYRDQTMTANSSTSTGVYPQEDDDGNPVGLISSMRTCMLMGASSL